MNRLTDMITNFGGVILGCIVLKFWGFCKPAGIAVMLFSAFEVVIHIVIGITSMKTFGDYGMNTLYSPGLITSLFGFLPAVIGLAKELFFVVKNVPRLSSGSWQLPQCLDFAFCLSICWKWYLALKIRPMLLRIEAIMSSTGNNTKLTNM